MMKKFFKFLRKNQRKALAILCVVGMVSFIAGLAPGGFKQIFNQEESIGTLNGKSVGLTQIQNARQVFLLLKALRYTDPTRPNVNGIPLMVALLGYPGEEELQQQNSGYAATASIEKNDRSGGRGFRDRLFTAQTGINGTLSAIPARQDFAATQFPILDEKE